MNNRQVARTLVLSTFAAFLGSAFVFAYYMGRGEANPFWLVILGMVAQTMVYVTCKWFFMEGRRYGIW